MWEGGGREASPYPDPCRRLAIKPPESKINANATLMLIDLAQFLPVKGAGLLTR